MRSFQSSVRYCLAPANDGGPPVPYSTTVTIDVETGKHAVKSSVVDGAGPHRFITETEFVQAIAERDLWKINRAEARKEKANDG